MAANHKLTGVIKGRVISGVSDQEAQAINCLHRWLKDDRQDSRLNEHRLQRRYREGSPAGNGIGYGFRGWIDFGGSDGRGDLVRHGPGQEWSHGVCRLMMSHFKSLILGIAIFYAPKLAAQRHGTAHTYSNHLPKDLRREFSSYIPKTKADLVPQSRQRTAQIHRWWTQRMTC